MIVVIIPVRPKPSAIRDKGMTITAAIASWIPFSVRSSRRVGGSARRIIPAPSPPSLIAVPRSVAVRPTATTPKSSGVSMRARARLPKIR